MKTEINGVTIEYTDEKDLQAKLKEMRESRIPGYLKKELPEEVEETTGEDSDEDETKVDDEDTKENDENTEDNNANSEVDTTDPEKSVETTESTETKTEEVKENTTSTEVTPVVAPKVAGKKKNKK